MLSVLEARFPHAIKRILVCWGDPEAFEAVFSDLIIDKRGDRTGWPFDAWAELNFLQEVHDLAYGISKRSKTSLPGMKDGFDANNR
jgi:hypothetical protein